MVESDQYTIICIQQMKTKYKIIIIDLKSDKDTIK